MTCTGLQNADAAVTSTGLSMNYLNLDWTLFCLKKTARRSESSLIRCQLLHLLKQLSFNSNSPWLIVDMEAAPLPGTRSCLKLPELGSTWMTSLLQTAWLRLYLSICPLTSTWTWDDIHVQVQQTCTRTSTDSWCQETKHKLVLTFLKRCSNRRRVWQHLFPVPHLNSDQGGIWWKECGAK